jgi:hypothetical protein
MPNKSLLSIAIEIVGYVFVLTFVLPILPLLVIAIIVSK